MTSKLKPYYDVIVMGGGPAGSTLGALLRKDSDLRVAIIEKEVFPREHVGESMAHPMIPVLEDSGALPKVLASDCYVKKFGGVFNWDDSGPKVGLFDHADVLIDGVYRWAMHVDRPKFDNLLLEHAESLGADVVQGVSVTTFESDGDGCTVTLKDGTTLRGAYFVDASGRRNSIAAKQKRSWLSSYRNIAIWNHFFGGEFTQDLPGDWNVFREDNLSPVACFAFQDGWTWYIPVPKWVDGERRIAHSLGIVTNPEVLKQPGKDFTDQETFLRTVKQVPMLRDLVQNITPMRQKPLTATNYSMINDRFADYEGRWALIGDASYFVDPLFSSGVAFAVTQASAVALLLRQTLDGPLSEQHKQDLWRDYDVGWHGMAETFSLSIDQWYHAIGKNNPDSIYWHSRGSGIDLDIQERTFDALLNTAFTPDLLMLITEGSQDVSSLDPEGPFVAAAKMADPDGLFRADTEVSLADGVTVRSGPALDVPGFKATVPPPPYEVPQEFRDAVAHFWRDPVANGDCVPSPTAQPHPCHRFSFAGDQETEISALDRDGAGALAELLANGPIRFDSLVTQLRLTQLQLLKRLFRAGIVVETSSAQAAA